MIKQRRRGTFFAFFSETTLTFRGKSDPYAQVPRHADSKRKRQTPERVFWVTQAKDNMLYEVVGQHTAPCGNILRDEHIRMLAAKTAGAYPEELPHSNLLIHF